MRALWMVCVLASGVAGCPPAPATPAPVSIPEGQEGEPCAIGDRTVRTCGFRLVCVPKPVAAPDEKQLVSVDGAPCGGVGGIQCLAGLGCHLAADDVMVAGGKAKQSIFRLIGEPLEISEQGAPLGGTLGAIPISKRTATTKLVVQDQQTVVIGGLIRNVTSRAEEKVPVLGDIPVLGALQTIIKAVVSGFFACAVAACSAEAAPTTDPGSGSDQAAVEVRREEGKVTIQFGANQVVATERSGLRTVEYFEAGVWVGTVAYRPADRLMRIATPGFERTGVLPFDLDAALHDPNTALALTSALGITAEEQRVHLDRLTATDARLASDATVSSAFERHNVSAGGLSPKMWSICSSGRGALACAILTLGLCGYAMIYDCLVNP